MRRRTVASLAAAVALAGVAGGCGSGDDKPATPRAAWDGTPIAAHHPELPGDRIVTGRIRNEGRSQLLLFVNRARVLDAQGRLIRASVRYAAGTTHPLYSPRDGPRENPLAQQERLGDAAAIPPGGSAPLTIAWHAADGVPVKVDLGRTALALPLIP